MEGLRYFNKINHFYYKVDRVTYEERGLPIITLVNERNPKDVEHEIVTSLAYYDRWQLVDKYGTPLMEKEVRPYFADNDMSFHNFVNHMKNKQDEIIDKVNELTSATYKTQKNPLSKYELKLGLSADLEHIKSDIQDLTKEINVIIDYINSMRNVK